MRFVRRRKIHFKLQRFVLEQETQHSPGTQKVCCLSNRQSVCPLNNLQNADVAFRFRIADEQDVTTPQVVILAYPSDVDPPAVRRRTAGEFREGRAKAKITENTDQEWSVWGRKCAFWPLNKAGERCEIARLSSVLLANQTLSACEIRCTKQRQNDCKACRITPMPSNG